MANITGVINPIAETQKVYYTESSTIYEGMPVCFEFDATTNWRGSYVSSGAVTESTTTAEGLQNEGKYIRVEDPDADNLTAFAGVVAAGGWCGTSGPKVIEIYVPNGAIVPVRTDLYCYVGRTILAVESASQELTVPLAASNAVPVAIAWETKDRSSTSGIVLAKLQPAMFIRQEGDANSLLCDDDATAAETVNYINLNFAGTGGPKRGLYAVGEIAGAGHSNYGMWKFRTYINAAASQTVHTLCANLHIKDSGTLVDAGEWASSPLYVTVETEVTTTAPTLSGGSIAGIYFGYYVDESTAAPANAYVFHFNNHASYNWDGLLRFGAGDLGDYVSTSDAPALATGDVMIPIKRDSTTYYLVAFADTGV